MIRAALLLLVCLPALAEVPREALQYRRDLTREARAAMGLQAPIATLAGQIHQESAWNASARSYAGAGGLAQFMPGTATWIAQAYPVLGPADPYSPKWAIRAMVRYDAHLLNRFPGAADECERWGFALGSYNGGEGWMRKRIARSAQPDRCFGASCDINPGILPANQAQNRDYPHRIIAGLAPAYERAGWGRNVCAGRVP